MMTLVFLEDGLVVIDWVHFQMHQNSSHWENALLMYVSDQHLSSDQYQKEGWYLYTWKSSIVADPKLCHHLPKGASLQIFFLSVYAPNIWPCQTSHKTLSSPDSFM